MTTKTQQHIDAAGRLAALIDHMSVPCELLDVLAWCSEANVVLANDAKVPQAAFIELAGGDG